MTKILLNPKITSFVKGKNYISNLFKSSAKKAVAATEHSEIIDRKVQVAFQAIRQVEPQVTAQTPQLGFKVSPQLTTDVVEVKKIVLKRDYKFIEETCENISDTTKSAEIENLKNCFIDLRKEAFKNNTPEEFCSKMTTLTKTLLECENEQKQKLGKIFIEELIRTPKEFGYHKTVIPLAEEGLKCSYQANDRIQALEYLTYLQKAYKENGDKKKSFETMKESMGCVDHILNNYSTLPTGTASRERFLKYKAHLKSDFASMIAHKKRNKAIQYLLEAKTINEQLGLKRNVRFIDVQIQRIKTSKMINKLQEYSSRDMGQYLYTNAIKDINTGKLKTSSIEPQYRRFKD